MATTTATMANVPARRDISHFRQAMLSLYWFGSNAHWTAILLTTLPAQAYLIGGDEVKGRTLAIVLGIGAFVSMVVAPVFGALSDRITLPFGRRRPWIVLGTVMNVLGLLGLIYFPRANDMSSLPLYVLAFMWVEFWNNVATAPYSALIPDIVPFHQRTSASGWYGIMTMLGSLFGATATFIFTHNGQTDIASIYYYIGGLLLFGMLGTVIFTQEPKVKLNPPPFDLGKFLRGLIEPLRDHDFRWVFWTRFLMVMGTFTVQGFLQYYMRDVVKDFSLFGNRVVENAEVAGSGFGAAVLSGGIISTIFLTFRGSRYGRKASVYVSSALQAVVPVIFIFFHSFEFAVIMGLVFGLGYGAYQAVDWALASDVLPSETDYAKDMGVWHVALTFPQVIAVPIAGIVLDNLQLYGKTPGVNQPTLGYTAIFLLAVVYFVLGTVLVRRIRKVK